MNGDGITAECVQDKQIESLGRLFLEREPCITDHAINCGYATVGVTEVFGGGTHYGRVDFVESEIVIRPAIRSERCHAESDDANTTALGRANAHRASDAALWRIIGGRDPDSN